MTYNKKKSLYESIMKQVARIVRKRIDAMNESKSEGIQVKPYTAHIYSVGNSDGVKFYVDTKGKFYDKDMRPTKDIRCLNDYDATYVANYLNKEIGQMFHWEMFRK